jgi:hypothetical protein
MRFKVAFLLIILAGALILAAIIKGRTTAFDAVEADAGRQAGGAKTVPVLVELFTSEGCSSCPPADELLARLDASQPVAGAEVIALSEHVDYWNRLGWADPFSSAEASARQNLYASRFGRDDVYTPQMVVDGREEFVGSSNARARQAISAAARSAKGIVTVSLASNRRADAGGEIPIAVRIESLPEVSAGDTAEVLLAITESNLRSQVLRGENSGRRLSHAAVVRRLSVIGSVDSQKREFSAETNARVESGWKRENLKAVVFVQERESRRVLGAASIQVAAKQ